MDLERGERIALFLLGVLISLFGVLLLTWRALPGPVRLVLALAPLTVGLSCCWAATFGWAEVGSGQRRERPEELLAVERVFLLPIAVLGLAGLGGILVDSDLTFPIRLVLALSTATIIAIVGGLVIGRIRIATPFLGRREQRPPPPDL